MLSGNRASLRELCPKLALPGRVTQSIRFPPETLGCQETELGDLPTPAHCTSGFL